MEVGRVTIIVSKGVSKYTGDNKLVRTEERWSVENAFRLNEHDIRYHEQWKTIHIHASPYIKEINNTIPYIKPLIA